MVIRPSVQFENDMSALLVELRVAELLPNGQGRLPKFGIGQFYHFIWPIPTEDRLNREQAAEQWSQWSRDDLVALIERGMDETLKQLASPAGNAGVELTLDLVRAYSEIKVDRTYFHTVIIATTADGERAVLRGGHRQLNWWGTEAEFARAVEQSLDQALLRLREWLELRCRALT